MVTEALTPNPVPTLMTSPPLGVKVVGSPIVWSQKHPLALELTVLKAGNVRVCPEASIIKPAQAFHWATVNDADAAGSVIEVDEAIVIVLGPVESVTVTPLPAASIVETGAAELPVGLARILPAAIAEKLIVRLGADPPIARPPPGEVSPVRYPGIVSPDGSVVDSAGTPDPLVVMTALLTTPIPPQAEPVWL